MTVFDTKQFITDLWRLGERQFAQEHRARRMIEERLRRLKIPYIAEEFETFLPRAERAELKINGRRVPCCATSMTSGIITTPNHLISSLTSSQNFLRTENINFNPLCSGISRSNHYFAPSLAVSRTVVPRILTGGRVEGRVRIRKERHRSANILVGNRTNPRHIIFSHYDSLYGGAVDNASGTALTLTLAARSPRLREHTLFVFAGNEELSYDEPIYWGHGYRVFEAQHRALLDRAQSIFVLDCIGFSRTSFVRDEQTVRLGFPVKHLSLLISKIALVIGDMQRMMAFYHSDLDRPDLITKENLVRAEELVVRTLSG